MAKGIVRRVKCVQKKVNKLISGFASRGRYAAGMAGEGYNGGYRDALSDVMLALNGVEPNRHGWWEDDEDCAQVIRPAEGSVLRGTEKRKS